MRKFVTVLTTALLVVMCASNVFAAMNADVTYNDVRVSTTSYAVSIHTDGKATDGTVEISYDENALTCVESKMEVHSGIDMYSVNVENGVVRISYLSEKVIPAGHLFTLFFDVSDEYVNKEVSTTVVCTANDATGAALTTAELVLPDTGNTDTEASTESTEVGNQGTTGNQSGSQSQKGTEVTTEVVTEAATEATEAATEVVTEATTEAPAKTPVEVKVDPTNEEAWKEVTEKLETITEEEELVVVFDETAEEAVVSKDFLEAVKTQEATVVLDLGNGVSWVINGATVTDVAADINFAVTVDAGEIPEEKIVEVAAGKEVIKISLAHDGDFGCEPEMKLEAGKENNGKYAKLYYYNPESGELEFVCESLVDEDGYVRLKFDHASDYVVVIDEAAQVGGNTVVEQPEAPASNTGMVIGLVALLAVVIVAVVAVMKKKAN